MSTTFGQLVDKVAFNIQSGAAQQETATWINQTGGIADTDTTFIVNETNQMGRGLIEIGDELIYVDKVDNLTKTVTVSHVVEDFVAPQQLLLPTMQRFSLLLSTLAN